MHEQEPITSEWLEREGSPESRRVELHSDESGLLQLEIVVHAGPRQQRRKISHGRDAEAMIEAFNTQVDELWEAGWRTASGQRPSPRTVAALRSRR